MRRLVYTPRAYVYIKDQDGTIHDLTRYVTEGNVTRRIDAVSSAEITLRNPQMIFTAHRNADGNVVGGKFNPMDPITIYLRRHRDYPVRVFTGFLDDADWLTLYPGTITLTASCTIKRLQYTFFDPALPYMQDFMRKHGWVNSNDSGQWISLTAMNEFNPSSTSTDGTTKDGKGRAGLDGSISDLLRATMTDIGHWDSNTVLIEALPDDLFTRMNTLAKQFADDNEEARKQFAEFMRRIIGEGDFGTGMSNVDLSGIDGSVAEKVYQVGRRLGVAPYSKLMISAFETGIVESNFHNLPGGDADSAGWRQERASLYPDPRNITHSAERYFTEGTAIIQGKAQGKAGTGYYQTSWSPGQLAQAIQGSAYPDRYEAVRSQAMSLLRKTYDKVDQGTIDNSGATNKEQNPDGSRVAAKQSRSKTKGGSNKGDSTSNTEHRLPVAATYVDRPTGAYGENRGDRKHAGEDFPAPEGSPVYAATSGICRIYPNSTSGYGNYIDLIGGPNGIWTRYGHLSAILVKEGQSVKAGDQIGRVGNTGHSFGAHLHFEVHTNAPGSFGFDGTVDPKQWLKGAINPSGDTSGASASGDSASLAQNTAASGAASGAAGAFFGALDLPSAIDAFAASMLSGEKSLMNDVPLLPFVQQLCNASMRHFQSLPDGRFYAFYPDYFGEMRHHPPYWEIEDIEILDGRVRLSDSNLVTHMSVVGDTLNPLGGTPLPLRSVFSSGVVTVFNVFMADSILDRSGQRKKNKEAADTKHTNFNNDPSGLDIVLDRNEVANFLNRYGARPHLEDAPMIKSTYFEMFLAYQMFMQAWARQFITPFAFTFMPELFPGGKVGFPDHGLQMYIEEVRHSWSYESGFVTQAMLSSPSTYGAYQPLLPPNMARAIIDPATPKKQLPQSTNAFDPHFNHAQNNPTGQ